MITVVQIPEQSKARAQSSNASTRTVSQLDTRQRQCTQGIVILISHLCCIFCFQI